MMQAATSNFFGMNWQPVAIVVTIVLFVIGGMLGLVFKLIVAAFSSKVELFEEKISAVAESFNTSLDHNAKFDRERLDRLNAALSKETEKRESLEADFRKHLADLPRDFVQRIDWIREFTKVDHKLDAIWKKVSDTSEKLATKGSAK